MKGEHAEYVIPLGNAFLFPPKKRIRKALNEIHRFMKKHTRAKETLVSNEVNEFIHKNSKNIPRRVDSEILVDGEKAIVFMKGGKALKEYTDKKAKAKKEKEEKKKAKKEAKEEPAEAEKKEKLEEKKAKEKAAQASEIKRK